MCCSFTVSDDGGEIQSQVLRVKLGDEVVVDAIGLAGGDFHIVPGSRQVTDDLRTSLRIEGSGPEIAANEADADGLLLVIGDREECLGWVAIDELDAENL